MSGENRMTFDEWLDEELTDREGNKFTRRALQEKLEFYGVNMRSRTELRMAFEFNRDSATVSQLRRSDDGIH